MKRTSAVLALSVVLLLAATTTASASTPPPSPAALAAQCTDTPSEADASAILTGAMDLSVAITRCALAVIASEDGRHRVLLAMRLLAFVWIASGDRSAEAREALATALAGASDTTPRPPADVNDFARSVEDYLKTAAVTDKLGFHLAETSCDTPSSVAAGTGFTCDAVAVDHSKYRFTVKITSADTFLVAEVEPVASSSP